MGEFDDVAAAFRASPLVSALTDMTERDDFSRLESSAKRQHFVPQLVLRQFARRDGSKYSVFQLDVTRGTPRRVDTETAASRKNLYTAVEEDGEHTNRLEGYLALVESHAAPALHRFFAEPLSLTNADRATLAFFVSIQTQRSPAAAAQINQLANALLQAHAGSMFSDRREFAERYREMFGDAAPEQIEQFRQDVLAAIREKRVRVADPGGAAFSAGLRHAAEQSFMLFAFEWTLLHRPGAFITSDRAFAIHDPTPPYPWATQAILSSPNSETTVPLSSDACLLLRPRGTSLAVEEIAAIDAETINLRTYGWAERYIFGASQETVVSVRRAAKRRRADVVRPKPQCWVFLLEPDAADHSIAEGNRRRGWPPRLVHNGVERDYIVVPADGDHGRLHARIDEIVERRVRKRLGLPEGDRAARTHGDERDPSARTSAETVRFAPSRGVPPRG